MVTAAPAVLSRERILQVADGLPSSPRVLAELQELLRNPDTGIDEATALLRRDVGLTARIIRMANSAIFGRGDPVASLEEALARVGFNEVFRITGMASAAQMMDFTLQFYGVSAQRLRENSLLTALLMEELAGTVGGVDARTAYTSGLLRSAGKIAIDATAQRDLRYRRPAPIGETALADWEKQSFGPTSNEIAGHLLKSWRFPADVFVPIRDHYLIGLLVEPLTEAKLLNVASGLAQSRNLGLPGEKIYWETGWNELLEHVRLSADLAETIADRAMTKFERLKTALG